MVLKLGGADTIRKVSFLVGLTTAPLFYDTKDVKCNPLNNKRLAQDRDKGALGAMPRGEWCTPR